MILLMKEGWFPFSRMQIDIILPLAVKKLELFGIIHSNCLDTIHDSDLSARFIRNSFSFQIQWCRT